MEYIEKHEPTAECFFCRELAHEDSPENLIVYRGQSAFAILNRFPYTSGHLMVAPYAHRDTLEALDPETRFEIMELANRAIVVLRAVYHPEAFNLGANIGTAAGAGALGASSPRQATIAPAAIADSAAPIWDNAGRMRGVVLVFRDVTIEQQASQAA